MSLTWAICSGRARAITSRRASGQSVRENLIRFGPEMRRGSARFLDSIQPEGHAEDAEPSPEVPGRGIRNSRGEPPRIRFLDGVRGFAIILVLVYHGNTLSRDSAFDSFLHDIFGSGWAGVDLFFVLSGFLITGILLDIKGTKKFFINFYARRFLRIFPLYYAVLFVLFFVYQPFVNPDNAYLAQHKEEQFWYWSYLFNFWVAHRGGWPDGGYLIHFWSLAVEEQFYLVWPTVVLLLNRSQLRFACLAAIFAAFALRVLLVFLGAGPITLYVSTATRIDTLAVGALIAVAIREPEGLAGFIRRFRYYGWASAAVVLYFFVRWGGFRLGFALSPRGFGQLQTNLLVTIGFSSLAFFFGSLVVLTISSSPSSWIVRIFSNRILVRFGLYSYSIYVIHWPICLFLLKRGITAESFPTVFGSHLPGQLICYLIISAACLVFGFLSWNLFEKHFLKLKKRFIYSAALDIDPQGLLDTVRRESPRVAAAPSSTTVQN